MDKAKARLFPDYPFWSMLGLLLDWVEDHSIPTMGVNQRELRYNPAFVESLTMPELIGALVHEIAHCAYRHWARIKQSALPFEIGNIAADYVINLEIIDEWGLQLPKGCLYDEQYKGMTLEQVAAKLMRDAKPSKGSGQGSGQGNAARSGRGNSQTDPNANPLRGDMDPNGGNSGQGKGKAGKGKGSDSGSGSGTGNETNGTVTGNDGGNGEEIDWGVEIERAYRVANSRGKLPSCVARRMQESKAIPEDWRAILLRFVQSIKVSDTSFARPSRRGISQGLCLPGPVKDGMGTMVVAIDTSGSIGDSMLGQFWIQVKAIFSTCKPERLVVLYCHAAVCHVDIFSEGDTPELAHPSSGGTAFQPVFDWVAEHGENPVCLVYLTDMQGDEPTQPNYPVLWCYPVESSESWHSVHWGEKVSMQG
jgi:predicted metal-dependent peptidase